MYRFHDLSKEEADIIIQKGTEPPGSGEYNHVMSAGVYTCRRCDFPLYLSKNKVASGCGWPSFDEEIPNHVLRLPDRDGIRIEIICARCKGHLGHVFEGEQITDTNVRHCVNSRSIHLESAFTEEGYERAIVGGGCFWGVEYFLSSLKGIVRTSVGYCGGWVVNPTYEEVCSGLTGHKEVVECIIHPEELSYENLIREFFEIHDPSDKGGQGPDRGDQYTSTIFVLSEKQSVIAKEVIEKLKKKGCAVETRIEIASVFYPADEYHQDYYKKNMKTPYCHKKVKRL